MRPQREHSQSQVILPGFLPCISWFIARIFAPSQGGESSWQVEDMRLGMLLMPLLLKKSQHISLGIRSSSNARVSFPRSLRSVAAAGACQ